MSKANPEKYGADLYDLLFWCGKQVREAERLGMVVKGIVLVTTSLEQRPPEGLMYHASLRVESQRRGGEA